MEWVMKRMAVLYHSGVGNTRKVSERVKLRLAKYYDTDIFSVEKLPEDFNISDYDGLVIGFPTIHTHPATRILKFIDSINPLPQPRPAYIFTTCGLYSANALRIFAKQCVKKNILPVVHRSFWGCPATDISLMVSQLYHKGALRAHILAPLIVRIFRFPKNIEKNISNDVNAFHEKMESGGISLEMPRFKLYSILNFPNKLAGQLITFPIFVHKSKCNQCYKCVRNCPSNALSKCPDGYPVFEPKKCEKCYRCIHHCPSLALSLSKKNTPKKVLAK